MIEAFLNAEESGTPWMGGMLERGRGRGPPGFGNAGRAIGLGIVHPVRPQLRNPGGLRAEHQVMAGLDYMLQRPATNNAPRKEVKNCAMGVAWRGIFAASALWKNLRGQTL